MYECRVPGVREKVFAVDETAACAFEIQTKMTEHHSTVEDHTGLTATDPAVITHQTATTGSVVTSSTPRGADPYFQSAVIVIGVVGTAAKAQIPLCRLPRDVRDKSATNP